MSLAVHPLAACLALAPCTAAWAQIDALCSSDGRPAPPALTERFINADCAPCWRQAGAAPPAGAAVLDWVLPGSQGDEAPLSAVARREALERLAFLHLPPPLEHAQHNSTVQDGGHQVRVAFGPVYRDYVGASLRFDSSANAPALQPPLTAWLALAEALPAGTEGSPVPRLLVRNLLSSTIAARNTEPIGQLWRPMTIPEGAQPGRLQLLGWVEDSRGRILAAAQTRCQAE